MCELEQLEKNYNEEDWTRTTFGYKDHKNIHKLCDEK